jgi:hypothetical protein
MWGLVRRITGLYMLRHPFGRLGLRKTAVGLPPFVRFSLRQILGALQTQRRVKNGLYTFAFAYSDTQNLVYSRNVMWKLRNLVIGYNKYYIILFAPHLFVSPCRPGTGTIYKERAKRV